jgi:hypothetical protein
VKLFIAAVIAAGSLGWSSVAPASAADLSSQRFHHRRDYSPRHARPSYEPTYYGRPVLYHPYGLVTLPFGLIIPYRTW